MVVSVHIYDFWGNLRLTINKYSFDRYSVTEYGKRTFFGSGMKTYEFSEVDPVIALIEDKVTGNGRITVINYNRETGEGSTVLDTKTIRRKTIIDNAILYLS